MSITRAVWKDRAGKIVGVNLKECENAFELINNIREFYNGDKNSCFLISGAKRWSWDYGTKQTCSIFFNKIVLPCPLQYEYIYLSRTGKLYKVVQG